MKSFFLFAVSALVLGANAAGWRNIDEDDYIAGAQISSPIKLTGRVVLVDVWGVNCPPCRALLPTLQQMWENFGLPANKPFIVLGSHRQERNDERVKALVKKAGVTYPVYQGAGIAEGEPRSSSIPFFYVINHNGKLIYKGHDIHIAQECVITALGEAGPLSETGKPTLTGGVKFVHYKQLEGRLELGKPIKNIVKKLELDANGKDALKADEAKKILGAIERGLEMTKEEIDFQKTRNPREAIRLIKKMKTTWPEEAEAAYKAELPALIAAAKKQMKNAE